MNKNFTHKFLKHVNRFFLLMLIAAALFTAQAYTPFDNGMQEKTIKCYPNPAVSYVNFDFPDGYTSKGYVLQVFSFTGKMMYETNVNSSKATLTFNNDFYRGLYIYQLHDKSGKLIETGKFQVTR